MQIRYTARVKDLMRLKKNHKISKKIMAGCIGMLEKFFGSPILVEITGVLQKFSLDTIETVDAINRIYALGILKEAGKLPKSADEPHCFFYRFFTTTGLKSTGADFLSEKKAIWKAYGESIERELWYRSDLFYRQKIKFTSYKKLRNRALNIFNISGFSIEQKDKLSNLKFNKDTVFGWIHANSIINNRKILCPVQLLSAKYHKEKVRKTISDDKVEPMLRWSVTTGLATGRCLDEAITKGVMEIIERDSFMVTYLNKLSPPRIDLENLSKQDEDFRRVLQSFRRYNLEVHIIEGVTDFPVYVYFAVIIDRTGLGPAVSVGASADFDKKTCILDALSEAFIVRISLKGLFRNKLDPGNINRHGRLLYWSKKENLDKLSFLTSGKIKEINFDNKEKMSASKNSKDSKKYYKEKKQMLAKELKKRNYEACYAELTSKKQGSEFGARSIYVVVPELQPLHLDESIPYFSGERLSKIPKKFGYEPAEDLNKEPHPFP